MGEAKRGLAGNLIPRAQVRLVEQRLEARRTDHIDRAVLFFRGRDYLVPVINISSRGAMVQAGILPRIGESVVVQFDDGARAHAVVRWVRDGQIGLNFGQEILLG